MAATIERAKRFAETLELAIDDKLLEAREDIHFFYDADVTIDTVIGLTTWDRHEQLPDIADKKFVVRALLSTGYLPLIEFLRPHLAEVYRVLRALPDTAMSTGFHAAAMRVLASRWSIPEDERTLRDSVDDPKGFYEFIKREGHSVFVKLELCLGGHWKPRLTRLYRTGRIRVEPLNSDLSRVPSGDPVEATLATRIVEGRKNPNLDVNSRVDAQALAELHRLASSGFAVRFYTETEALRAVLTAPDVVQRYLHDARGHPLFRDEDYFLMRSSFAALSFPHNRNVSKEAPEQFDLAVLQSLLGKLSELILGARAVDNQQFTNLLATERFRGQPLSLLIDDFYDLQFLRTVFLSWDPPPTLREWLPALYEAKSEAGIASATRDIVTTSLDSLWETIETQIGYLRNWREDYVAIRNAADERATAYQGALPSLWLELGLGRWGLEETLPSGCASQLEKTLRDLLDRSSPARWHLCSDLALRIADRSQDEQSFAYALCLLWILRLDRLVTRFYEENIQTQPAYTPPGLRILNLISRAMTTTSRRSGAQSRNEDLAEILDACNHLVRGFDGVGDSSLAAFARMGAAHVAYIIWREGGQKVTGRSTDLVTQSFQWTSEAANTLDRGSLAWSFAVNHCAYLGVRTQLFGPSGFEFMKLLVTQIPREHDHYRFRDTQAWEYTVQVQQQLGASGELASRASLNSEETAYVCALLNAAADRLAGVRFFGDREFDLHLQLIAIYASRCGCTDALITVTKARQPNR